MIRKSKRVGWKNGEDLYAASIILSHRQEKILSVQVEIPIPWKPVVRVSQQVVRRRGGEKG